MTQTKQIDALTSSALERPRFEEHGPMLIAGLSERYTCKNLDQIPAQWQRFAPHIGNIAGQVGRVDYGVCLDLTGNADGFDYVAGVEVADFAGIPGDWAQLRIPAQKYAIFPHVGHVSRLRYTVQAIMEKWLPASGHQLARTFVDRPGFLERYGEEFDPQTGTGGIELWIPLER
jgi:AraC family transcriptional regulator